MLVAHVVLTLNVYSVCMNIAGFSFTVAVCRLSFASVTIGGLSGRNLFMKLYLPYVFRTFLVLLVVFVI